MASALLAAAAWAHPAEATAILTRPTLNSDAKPDSEEALRFCVAASGSDEKAWACTGSTLDDCVKHIDDAGGTDLNYSTCQTRELAFWDRLLNERYRALMQSLSDRAAEKAKLKAAQQGWLKLRGNLCGIVADMPGSTYYVSNMFTRCELTMTAKQVIELGGLSEVLRR